MKQNNPEFERLMKLAANACMDDEAAFFDELDTTNVTTTARTRRLVERANRKAKRRSPIRLKKMKRIAVACVIAGAILLGTVMGVPPVRASLWDKIISWYREYVGVFFEKEDAPVYVEGEFLPAYLPDGWTIEAIGDSQSGKLYMISGTHEETIYYRYRAVIEKEVMVDNHDCIVEKIKLNNEILAYFCTYPDGRVNLTWQGEYTFVLEGNKNLREILISIAESIKK